MNSGALAGPVVNDLQQIGPGLTVHGGHSPVIEQEDVSIFERIQPAPKGAVGVPNAQFLAQAWNRIAQLPEQAQAKAKHLLHRVDRILTQPFRDKRKLYALHAPEVECISKGKARTPYEFGVKVTIATTLKEGLVLGMRSMPGNPYDGHRLGEAIEQVEILANNRPRIAIVDKGYRGVQVQRCRSSDQDSAGALPGPSRR